ncbi:Nudix family hydrolase [Orrella sp. 11846]|uniref:Nudix family hydrolase n=1 Tax=Orrella sp. 11846 TaxID=3409913 RepID=UPI003B5A1766
MPEPASKVTEVAVGLLINASGQVLLGSRPTGKPWAGWWELPGGKIEAGETVLQALTRELQEEINITVQDAIPWVSLVYHYPTTTVRLNIWQVTQWDGTPTPLENQELDWLTPDEALARDDLLPATYPLLRWLRIPRRYLISHVNHPDNLASFLKTLGQAHAQGIELVQWREPQWQTTLGEQSVKDGFLKVLAYCQRLNMKLLVNSVHPESWWTQADGVHLRAQDATNHSERPKLADDQWVGVSAHNAEQLTQARLIKADFAVLGPVLPTASHPGEPTLGWEAFAELAQFAGLPVLTIGGQSNDTYPQARRHGAHGIAGIRHLLNP